MDRHIEITSIGAVGSLGSSVLAQWADGIVSEIDFNSVASGTVVDTVYEPWGVAFDAVGLSSGPLVQWRHTGHAFASSAYDTQDADPNDTLVGKAQNVISIFLPPLIAGLDDSANGGGVRAVFKRPKLFVSIDVKPIVVTAEHTDPEPTTLPYMQVFGPAPTFPHRGSAPLLATVYFPLATSDSNFESWQTMKFVSLSPTPNIGSIVFSSKTDGGVGAPVVALFVNLRFAHGLPNGWTNPIG